MTKVFVTGSNGFVGKHLINELDRLHLDHVSGNRALYGDIKQQTNWEKFLEGVDVVVHLAARVHVMNEVENDPMKAFREINVEVTRKLAEAAKKMGVKRFIYLSSVKVNGEETFDKAFTADDKPLPLDPYGISKMEAEEELLKLHSPGIFEVIIIRPPLVYGPGVRANFEKLFWLVKKDLPIPFGRVQNKRSLVSVYNLVSLIVTCFNHPKAGGQIFLVKDLVDYSLAEIIENMAEVEKKTAHLLPVPVSLMRFASYILGKKSYTNRLFGNLHLDIKKTTDLLGWNPPYTFKTTYLKND